MKNLLLMLMVLTAIWGLYSANLAAEEVEDSTIVQDSIPGDTLAADSSQAPLVPTKHFYTPRDVLESKLFQNYPNPFNSNTRIGYLVADSSQVSLKLFNLLGQQIGVLVDTIQAVGQHEVEINLSNFSSGIYFYRIDIGSDYTYTKKMTFLR